MALTLHGNNGLVTTNGTAAMPSLCAPDNDTGIYFGTNLVHAATDGTERLRITSTGAVQARGGSGDAHLCLHRTNAAGSNGNTFGNLYWNDNNSNIVARIRAIRSSAVDDADLLFETRPSGGSSIERLRIYASGNVNFGAEKAVAFPSGTGLQVYHSANPRIKLSNDNTGFAATDGTQLYLASDGTTILDNKDTKPIRFDAGGTERLRIGTSGEILTAGVTSEPLYPAYTTARKVQVEIKGGIDVGQTRHHGSLAINCTNENATLHLIRSQSNNSADLDAGVIGFTVFDGTDFHQCARIMASRDAGGGNNDTPGRLTFHTTKEGESSATEKMRITSDGEVFIGANYGGTNRSTLLSISGANQDPTGVWTQVGVYSNDSVAQDKGGSIGFGGHDGSVAQQQFAAIKGAKENATSNNTAGYMAFYTRPAGAVSLERMRIKSTGEVEINPAANNQTVLSCEGAGTDVDIQTWARSGGAVKMGMRYVDSDTMCKFGSVTSHGFGLMTGGGEKVRINSTGEVSLRRGGISAIPSLEIYGSGNASDADADNLRIHNWGDSTGDYWQIGSNLGLDSGGNNAKPSNTFKGAALCLDGRQGRVFLKVSPSSSSTVHESLVITSNGNVGVGLPTPGETFHMKGFVGGFERTDVNSGTFERVISIKDGGGVERGSIKCNNANIQIVGTTSDYRLKENLTSITDGITRLKALKLYKFNYKQNPDTTLDGFLAHEVDEILPEAVSGTKDQVVVQSDVDKGEYPESKLGDPIYQGLDLSKFVPLLTAALQEAITKIETLETKVAALESA